MELILANAEEKVVVSAVTFGQDFNEHLVHQVVNAYLAKARSGTHKQKTRAEVRGGGIKPWKQKGTGRARAGSIRSPIWRTGGKTFAAVPANYSQKVNKKMYQGAMRSILSELVRQERLVLVKDLSIESPKTKQLLSKLKELGVTDALLVVDRWDINLYLAARNVSDIDVCEALSLDPVSLIKYEKVVMTAQAVNKIQEVLG
eukprot:TRINITY_DN20209_c0_g1_i1.p1 TRINITY_DN20209_c0_g1~~TRINITY_DN20209_c0_g1_i1.p1  ORF type:complete len:202 (+),score=6.68 TRINITY_DN20209_c0_g1_i1:229-834(+)